jgi:hypothetical protein
MTGYLLFFFRYVWQWLYIIAGVLFPACRQAGFVLSFAQAKERTYNSFPFISC